MHRHTIRFSLFATYALIILLSFTALSAYLAASEIRRLSAQVFVALKQNAQSLAASMDGELDQMNRISMNVCYSNLVKDQFAQYLNSRQEQRAGDSISNAKVLSQLLISIIGPSQAVDQVNLYGMTGGMVANGLDNNLRNDNVADTPWYNELIKSERNRVIAYTGEDAYLSKYYTYPDGKRFITLARQYIDNLWIPQGFVEVKSSVRKVLAATLDYTSVYGESVAVFDEHGTPLLYCDAEQAALWTTLEALGFPREETLLGKGADASYVLCQPSGLCGFQTVMFISRAQVLAPVSNYQRNILGIGLCVLVLALLLAYIAAKRLTDPIQAICSEVAAFDLQKPLKRGRLGTRFVELVALHDSFLQMQQKIETGMQLQLSLQEQELQSRMLALQSQMNPHFLYNSLAAIQSMADEGMKDEIIDMCQAMSHILRYVSSDVSPLVPLKNELECTEEFLKCMALRYQGDLSYELDVPPDMLSVPLPKLCLQLLCENAIKFATQSRPPWLVRIRGATHGDRYELTITDNGPGFSASALKTLNESIQKINETGLLPSLSIGGMGLLNIYMRCKLLYRKDLIFVISNCATGGASVTIGGYYEHKALPTSGG